MTKIPITLRQSARLGAVLAAVPAILLLGSINTAWAKKGGNGGGGSGGGGEEPPAVELVPAPVEYQITWIDWPERHAIYGLLDVNSSGIGVGWIELSESHFIIGIMGDAAGNSWDLDDYFAEALQAYPGWRYLAATAINANGQVAGILVPEGDQRIENESIVVIGDIHAVPPTLTTVDHFFDATGTGLRGVPDMTEQGEILVHVQLPEEQGPTLLLYPSPNSLPAEPEVVPVPEGGSIGIAYPYLTATVNGSGQVAYTADFTTTSTTTRGRKTTTTETTTYNSMLWDTNGSPFDLGDLGNRSSTELSEAGRVYAKLGSYSSGIVHQWSPVTLSWDPISPAGATLMGISKASANEEVLMTNGSQAMIYQEGLGTFGVTVTSGLNGPADVDRLVEDAELGPWFHGISRPDLSGYGSICGQIYNSVDGYVSFILTPVQP